MQDVQGVNPLPALASVSLTVEKRISPTASADLDQRLEDSRILVFQFLSMCVKLSPLKLSPQYSSQPYGQCHVEVC